MMFQRYASPLVILDKMILTGRFAEFVREFVEIKNEETLDQTRWDFWLHRVFDMSFGEFLERAEFQSETVEKVPDEVLQETVRNSMGIINSFCPD